MRLTLEIKDCYRKKLSTFSEKCKRKPVKGKFIAAIKKKKRKIEALFKQVVVKILQPCKKFKLSLLMNISVFPPAELVRKW